MMITTPDLQSSVSTSGNDCIVRLNTRDEFEIAVICALPAECDTVLASFDETFDVVLSYMTGMGKTGAAVVASNLSIGFPSIQLALVVGIYGAVPTSTASNRSEITLGDFICDCIVEYNFGWQAVLSSLKLRETRREFENRLSDHLQVLHAQNPTWQHPGTVYNVLLEASYHHRHYKDGATCMCANCQSSSDPVCEEALLKDSKSLTCAGNPVIGEQHAKSESIAPAEHIGPVVCGDTVTKSGQHRDMLLVEQKE
ncbi:hypothetical protein RU639_013104 [Aspergillus parasiticus]